MTQGTVDYDYGMEVARLAGAMRLTELTTVGDRR